MPQTVSSWLGAAPVVILMYSSEVRKLLMNPKNGPKDAYYNVQGYHESREACKNSPERVSSRRIRFKLLIENDCIKEARVESFGCPVTMAAGKWCIIEMVGMAVEDVRAFFTVENIAAGLGMAWSSGLSDGCLTANLALLNALNNYESLESSS